MELKENDNEIKDILIDKDLLKIFLNLYDDKYLLKILSFF